MKIELPINDLQTMINKKSQEVMLEAMDENKIRVRIRKFKTNTLLEVSIIDKSASAVRLEYRIINGVMARLFNVLGILKSFIDRMPFVESGGSRNEYILHPFQIPALSSAQKDFLIKDIRAVNNTLIIEINPII
ncbi:hypothetical protein [Anditalea andensis]|uniref:Uncharacterized protein n=1 Tax=Anditalea andensis TaxID=1048983 RepID=A0A074KUY1_9BACT|nr:hypothetical protein [Anditalea andensis]KEO73786.1 hypothetical protein EL17_09760 [Anditalea andensis]